MLLSWNPWRDINQIGRLEREMSALFADRATALGRNGQNAEAAKAPTWAPAVDVYEDAERILLVADLPGVAQEEVEITVEKNVLTIRGERKAERRGEDAYQRVERVAGPFARSFTLPSTVDAERVGAELKLGVLTLTLPKKTEAQPRQIKVSVAS